MIETGCVRLPGRDADRRILYRAMLGITKQEERSKTVEELEEMCIKLGYLKVVENPRPNDGEKE